MADKPADVDPKEWDADATVADGVPLPVVESKTPRPDTTGRHRLTPAQFASGLELAERDGYQRGFEHGQQAARAQAEADAVTELRKVREDAIEAFRSLWVIFELGFPTWEEAERWARSRMTPL
jgi:hypothetical protein